MGTRSSVGRASLRRSGRLSSSRVAVDAERQGLCRSNGEMQSEPALVYVACVRKTGLVNRQGFASSGRAPIATACPRNTAEGKLSRGSFYRRSSQDTKLLEGGHCGHCHASSWVVLTARFLSPRGVAVVTKWQTAGALCTAVRAGRERAGQVAVPASWVCVLPSYISV